VYDVDLTNAWHWQSLLRSLPVSLMSSLLGDTSVASFAFRLLPHTPDTNYLARDSGARHVFELLRADDVAMHMHFHKDGKMDAPIQVWPSVFPGTGLQDVPQSGPMYRLQTPCTFDEICREQPYASGKIGKNQVQMALIAIMSSSCGTAPGVVNLTSGSAFDWRSWLTNTPMNREIIGDGITLVFALRAAQDDPLKLAFVRVDASYALFCPVVRQPLEILQDWSHSPGSALPAASCGIPWMHLRVPG
jgi:hypothetical protein